MATRERWLREVGPVLDLRGIFFGGSSAAPALNRPDPELEPENEDVRAPNIARSELPTSDNRLKESPTRDALLISLSTPTQ